ncbi:P1 family peptidase, partial [Mesorhizobium sp. M7A.F.Ca.US.005.03.2.1]|uniref:P1 family peptidase n=1 Tax=Mesorhizobium sp. M7A.F.Ca.US.005.03.2.1 TaxID=2496737 RepID=UPI001FE10435
MTDNPHHLATPSGKPRARNFGIGFDGRPGPFNAITDVPGVAVGYATLISGDGTLVVGEGPVRTGVTAILPRPLADLANPVSSPFPFWLKIPAKTGLARSASG